MISNKPLPVYVLNLERSKDRLSAILRSAEENGISVTRIAAIDGARQDKSDWGNVDQKGFHRRCGRAILPGEYGCYQSHILALKQIAGGEADAAIILEDDVEFPENFMPRVTSLQAALPENAVLKLVNHRAGGFLHMLTTQYDDRLGVCWMGPQASGAAYMVTKAAARQLLLSLKEMRQPIDIALERGWAPGTAVYTVEKNLLPFAGGIRGETLIASSQDYRATKFDKHRRVPSYLFKAIENFRRAGFAAKLTLLHRLRTNRKPS